MTATALGLAYKLNADITISGGYYDIKDKTNIGNKRKMQGAQNCRRLLNI